MERMIINRRLAVFGGMAFGISGCEITPEPPGPQTFVAGRGDVVLEMVHTEGQRAAYGGGRSLDRHASVGVTRFTLVQFINNCWQFERHDYLLRDPREGGDVYVSLPKGFRNQMVSGIGTTSRIPASAYSAEAMKGARRPKPGHPFVDHTKTLIVPVTPEQSTIVQWHPFRVTLLPSPPHLLSYRIERMDPVTGA